MARRVVEVFYELKDLFTGQVKKITGSYSKLRDASDKTADKIRRDNKRASKSFDGLSTKVNNLRSAWFALSGLIAGGALTRNIKGTADELDRLGKTSRRLGITANELQGLEFAADRTGVPLEKITKAIETLQKRTGEAAQGIGQARRAFERLGISVEDFSKLDATEQFVQLADSLRAVADEEERAALTSQLFSKQNLILLNLFNEGGDAIADYVAKAVELNNVTEEQTKAAENLNDAITDLKKALTGDFQQAGASFIQDLNLILGAFGKLSSESANLEAQLKFARAELGLYAATLGELSDTYKEQLTVIEELEKQQSALRITEEVNARIAERAAERRRKQNEENQKYLDGLKSITDDFEDLSERRIAAIEKEAFEFEAAQSRQKRVAEEFANLYDSITGPELNAEDVSLGDVFAAQRQAAIAAEEGDAERAVKLARDGFELLELLKEKGSETSGTLKFLASQLRSVAEEAAAKDVAKEGTEVDKAKLAFAEIQKQADLLKTNAPAAGKEYAQLFLEGARAEFAAANLPAPTVQPIKPLASSFQRGENSFGDGTSFQEPIERGASK